MWGKEYERQRGVLFKRGWKLQRFTAEGQRGRGRREGDGGWSLSGKVPFSVEAITL
jgi:hypothetical protein